MNQKSGVAKDLKLLPDFITDVAVVGMKFSQFASEMGSTAAPAVVWRALAANTMACVRAAAGHPFVSMLRTDGYKCMAFLDRDGRWVDLFSRQFVSQVLGVVPA